MKIIWQYSTQLFWLGVILIGQFLNGSSSGSIFTGLGNSNKRLLNSFSTSNVRTKIYTATYTFENLLSAIIALAVSAFLDFASTAVCFTLLGVFAGVAFYFLLKYMKTRVGLKPEEYRKEDINLIDVK